MRCRRGGAGRSAPGSESQRLEIHRVGPSWPESAGRRVRPVRRRATDADLPFRPAMATTSGDGAESRVSEPGAAGIRGATCGVAATVVDDRAAIRGSPGDRMRNRLRAVGVHCVRALRLWSKRARDPLEIFLSVVETRPVGRHCRRSAVASGWPIQSLGTVACRESSGCSCRTQRRKQGGFRTRCWWHGMRPRALSRVHAVES